MAKEIEGYIKLQIRGGQANPAPPVGPALGAKGINIMDFCKQFNGKTQDRSGKILPVVITLYKDKSFDFIVKTPPAAALLMEAANKKKGSSEPNRLKVGQVTWDQVKAIAEEKMVDLNAFDIEPAMRIVAGTARSMGFIVQGVPPWGGEASHEMIATEEEIEAATARAQEAAAEAAAEETPSETPASEEGEAAAEGEEKQEPDKPKEDESE